MPADVRGRQQHITFVNPGPSLHVKPDAEQHYVVVANPPGASVAILDKVRRTAAQMASHSGQRFIDKTAGFNHWPTGTFKTRTNPTTGAKEYVLMNIKPFMPLSKWIFHGGRLYEIPRKDPSLPPRPVIIYNSPAAAHLVEQALRAIRVPLAGDLPSANLAQAQN